MIKHEKQLYSLLSLLSEFGGFFEAFLFPFFYFLSSKASDKIVIGKFIRQLFFVPEEQPDL